MSVLYIDTEHDRVRGHAEYGSSHRGRIAEVRQRLANAAGAPCLVQPFAAVSPAAVEQIAPAAIVIGGSCTDWADYDFAELGGLLEVIRAAPVPILGICAGHQLIGRAHGAAWGPLDPPQPGETDPEPAFGPGYRKERGFLPVAVDSDCPLFQNVMPLVSFFQRHSWQLTEAPPGFVTRAGSRWSAIQAMERVDRPVFGVQFHPERYNATHPHGAAVLRNFLALAGSVIAHPDAAPGCENPVRRRCPSG